MAGGRKNKYASHVQPYLQQIDDWLNDGASEEQVANKLGIAYSTFNKYKQEYEELRLVCEKPRSKLVDELKSALVKSALGHTYEEKKQYIKEDKETGKKFIYTEITTKYQPPNTTAIIIALRMYDKENRGEYDIQTQQIDLRSQELELRKELALKDKW